jgi:hypothetical protein
MGKTMGLLFDLGRFFIIHTQYILFYRAIYFFCLRNTPPILEGGFEGDLDCRMARSKWGAMDAYLLNLFSVFLLQLVFWGEGVDFGFVTRLRLVSGL